jgi:GNAT superfamily N-acetyltransferase
MLYTELLQPAELNPNEWRELQAVSRASFATLDRSQAEIDHFVSWSDPERFHRSRIDPNSEVGKSLNPDQSFSNAWVALAVDGNDVIGHAYAANNVSGSNKLERAIKLLGTQKRYWWFREIAVLPDYRRLGLAKDLGAMLVTRSQPWQPATAYIWPDETQFMPQFMRRATFQPTGEQLLPAFGEDARPVRQVRVQAPSTYGVVTALTK